MDYAEEQQMELEALTSIFADDLEGAPARRRRWPPPLADVASPDRPSLRALQR